MEKRETSYPVGGDVYWCIHYLEHNGDSSKKLKKKNRATILSSNSTLRYFSKESKNTNSKRHIQPYVYFSIIYYSQDTETIQVSTNRGIDEEDVIYMCVSTYTW